MIVIEKYLVTSSGLFIGNSTTPTVALETESYLHPPVSSPPADRHATHGIGLPT